MAEREDLPEEIVLNIFSRLPVKSLIRFTSLSKRMYSTILHDPKFARSQFQAAARHPRRLLCTTSECKLRSLQLDDTASFGTRSSLSRLRFSGASVMPLGSSNGLVFLLSDESHFYIWNPSTGLCHDLPQPHAGTDFYEYYDRITFYAAGYSSSMDDYKVFIAYYTSDAQADIQMRMYSMRANAWKTIQPTAGYGYRGVTGPGTVLNQAMHWVNETDMVHDHIVVFDFGQDDFRTMPLPDNDHDFRTVGVSEGCLCVCGELWSAKGCVEFWVMREYNVNGSWAKLFFSVNLSDMPFSSFAREFLIMESSTLVVNWYEEGLRLVNVDNKQGKRLGGCTLKGYRIFMTEYEESLLWITGYPIEEKIRNRVWSSDFRRPLGR